MSAVKLGSASVALLLLGYPGALFLIAEPDQQLFEMLGEFRRTHEIGISLFINLSIHEHVGVGAGGVGTGKVAGASRRTTSVRLANVFLRDARHRLIVEAMPRERKAISITRRPYVDL